MTIRSKILAGCLALTMLSGVLGLYAQRAEQELGQLALRIYDEAFMGVSYLRSAQAGFASLAASHSSRVDDAAVASVLDDLTIARQRAMSPAGQSAAADLSRAIAAWANLAGTGSEADTPAEKAGNAAALDAQAKVLTGFEDAVEVFAGDGFRYRRGIGEIVTAQQTENTVVLVLVLAGALLITIVLNRFIAPPVRRAVGIAQAIAAGNLENRIPLKGRGETAELLRALAAMQSGIAAALARIKALMADQEASHAGELAQQHARMEAALGNMNQGLCLFDGDSRLAVFNTRFAEMFGAPVLGATTEEVLRGAGLSLLLESTGDGSLAALTCELPDGRTIAVSQQPIIRGGWVTTYEDTSERRATETRLAHMARHDPLTGLPNRLAFSEHLTAVLGRARQVAGVAVLRLRLDRSRNMGDLLGPHGADLLLAAVAARLKDAVRETDLLVRLGSEEFAILQEGTVQPLDATLLAERLVALMAEPLAIEGHQVVAAAFIGIAVPTVEADTPDTVLQAAGLALHRAETEGRGNLRFYEAGMDQAMQLQRALEADLRQALPNGQLALFFQPLVHAGGIAGFEALLRWRHPERGLVSPAVFIPLAEQMGLIGEIGAWVMREACIEAVTWPGALKVAVNLSPLQFQGRSLIDDATLALAVSGLPATRLELEITESVLIQDDASVLTALHALRHLGIRIAMDDFGTGYSSLSYLHRFPFDKIKIDQSFVRGMTGQGDSKLIVRAIIGLGRSLGMMVNAEGVETPEQRDALRAEGCNELQGYLFSKPRPNSEVIAMLRQDGNATLTPSSAQTKPAAVAVLLPAPA